MKINENPNNAKAGAVSARKAFYNWLARNIHIDGIGKIERDLNFDNDSGRSGGIRLFYKSHFPAIIGVKDGLLLEVGFDTVSPNSPLTISSWAYDKGAENEKVEVIDNRAVDVKCYDHCYTFVEKLQTIATKFRREQVTSVESQNFMRLYYDIYCLLADQEVQSFLGTDRYLEHKQKRFPAADLAIPIAKNQAFLLTDEKMRTRYKERYEATTVIYYNGQPDFEAVMAGIRDVIEKL